jgi:hypothetical protein
MTMTAFEEFACLVRSMRIAQQAYFRTYSTDSLQHAEKLERKVDKALDEYAIMYEK